MPSSPPINSTTTSASLLARDKGSVVKFSTLKPRALLESRALTPTTTKLRPARATRSAACAESALMTPPPTVPRPAIAILSGSPIGVALFGRRQVEGWTICPHGEKFLHIASRLADAVLILY